MQRKAFDVAIVGGGVMGLSSAYWLSRENLGKTNPTMRVAIFEQDSSFQHASSLLSAGGVRQQFSNKENILLSQHSIAMMRGDRQDLFAVDKDDLMLKEHGYLLLSSTDQGNAVLHENVALQSSLGAHTAAESPEQLKEMFPWMDTDGVLGGSYGWSHEGWFDPGLFHSLLRKKCKEQGVFFYEDTEVIGMQAEGSRVTGLDAITKKDGRIEKVSMSHTINAGGCGAARIASFAGWEGMPIEPRKRYTFSVQSPGWVNDSKRGCFRDNLPEEGSPKRAMPLLVDATGVWIRPEGNGFICGSPPDEDTAVSHDDFEVKDDSDDIFMEKVWPNLATRVPALEEMRVASRWVGHYEYNTADQNGLIGLHDSKANVVYCNGFSGHGIQQGLAAGRAVSELITHGEFQTLDLTRMSPNRLNGGELLVEKNVV